MPKAMVISPHADDAAIFCGGTMAKWTAAGWDIVLVRVTDDATDSVGLTMEETVARNRTELREAAAVLGIETIEELGFRTDYLSDVAPSTIRERMVYMLRKHRPYAVFSFDPDGRYEGNLDHKVTAMAVEEAYWVACYDLHHPEHFEEGLASFTPCERWYFARELPEVTRAEDITDFLATKIEAVCRHKTQLAAVANLSRLQVRTWGRTSPLLEAAIAGEVQPIVEMAMTSGAQAAAAAGGLPEGRAAELFRVVRFGDLEPLMGQITEVDPDAEPAPQRPWLGNA
jgi:LmbE family N-acetylglucosaminyl deacetylase